MIATTGNEVTGRTIARYLGIVRGIVVRSPTIAQAIMGGLKSIVDLRGQILDRESGHRAIPEWLRSATISQPSTLGRNAPAYRSMRRTSSPPLQSAT
jgi:hypothetical protein